MVRGIANLSWQMAFQRLLWKTFVVFILITTQSFSDMVAFPKQEDHDLFVLRRLGLFMISIKVVEEAWNAKKDRSLEALAKVKEDSISFNKDVFGNIFKRKHTIEGRLQGIQKSIEKVDSISLVRLENHFQHEYNEILFQEELHWYQKSRGKWVKLGDKNTAFFHAQTVIRRKE